MTTVKTNSLKAWGLAMRPKTLTAAAVPVMLAVALALKDCAALGANIRWVPALLCLLFAWVMQIDSNLVNDYFDFKHGNDDETRLGPKRACAEGWITLPAMRRGIVATTLLGCAIGLPLVLFGGWEMVGVGVCCVVFCFLYTTCLSYLGLGDLLVLAFFGIVPVCCTYYLVMPLGRQWVSAEAFLFSLSCGMVVDTLLIVNNYRDHNNDKRAGKKTLVVHIGKLWAERLYAALGLGATLMALGCMGADIIGSSTPGWQAIALPFAATVYMGLHLSTYHKMRAIGEGRQLNKVLGLTARNIFVFGLAMSIAILCLC